MSESNPSTLEPTGDQATRGGTTPTADELIRAIDAAEVLPYEYMNAERTGPTVHHQVFDQLRERDPLIFGDAAGHPYWLFTRMEDILHAFQTPEVFSNSAIVMSEPDPTYLYIPEMLDGGEHAAWRALLADYFSPRAVSAMESRVRERFLEILDEVAPRGRCDFVKDVAIKFPNVIFMEMLGLPVEDAALFQKWESDILHSTGEQRHVERPAAFTDLSAYFTALIAERRKTPETDLLSEFVKFEIDGRRVTDSELLSLLILLFTAGLDTVAMQLSYSFHHFATVDSDRRKIVAQPDIIPLAVEELLRYYAFVAPGRKLMSDHVVSGCPVRAGQMVYLSLASANRDPRSFPDADQVVLDRSPNRHLAFGAGRHRCVGSHLARRELDIGIREWHRRIPEYEIDPSIEIIEHGGQFGLNNLPLRWDT
jgi:cytochrome P450